MGYAWHYAQAMTPLCIVLSILVLIPLFNNMHETADLFTSEPRTMELLLQVLPILLICFFFDVLQQQSKGVIRGLNLQKGAVWITLIAYYVVAIPVGLCFAFRQQKGVEGLRAGVLVGQLVLVTLQSILIDCLTNWQNLAHQAQERIYKESHNLPLPEVTLSNRNQNSHRNNTDLETGTT